MHRDPLVIAGRSFHSRLLAGTARYPSPLALRHALEESGAEIVTVAIRRTSQSRGVFRDIDLTKYTLLPNTAGCYTARDAVFTAHLAREALGTNWIKLEIFGDHTTLYPDSGELIQAARELVKEGFIIFPYTLDDPVVCRKLEDIGCAAVMPLGSPIGSGRGIMNPYNISIIAAQAKIPVIIDAGIGTPSDVVIAMELGVDAVLIDTAIAQAQHPVVMASAMKHACIAGRLARHGGRTPKLQHAEASSPAEGVVEVS
jgi:thiazole synthase